MVDYSIEFSCMAPITSTVMVMRGLVFHPLFFKVAISGSYLVCLCVHASLFRESVVTIGEFDELYGVVWGG